MKGWIVLLDVDMYCWTFYDLNGPRTDWKGLSVSEKLKYGPCHQLLSVRRGMAHISISV